MLYREITALCSDIHTKHINILCGQNVELLNVEPNGTYSDHWALKGTVAADSPVSTVQTRHEPRNSAVKSCSERNEPTAVQMPVT